MSHDGEISVFHGSSALKQAMEAADHGDIISLTGGRYEASNITKAITLRGAGMEEDTIYHSIPTKIEGDFKINIPDDISEHLTIEGIHFLSNISIAGTLNNAMLQKSHFNQIYGSSANAVTALTCIHCIISDDLSLPINGSANFINSIVIFSSSQKLNGNMEFTNCFLEGSIGVIRNSYIANCIFYSGSDSDWRSYFDYTNVVVYCVGYTRYLSYGGSNSPFPSESSTNKYFSYWDSGSSNKFYALFKSGSSFRSNYELTDEAKAEYVGSDGTEVGIHGGNLPWDVRILNPQITKCNVAAKTTADGKLSVDIEVKAAE